MRNIADNYRPEVLKRLKERINSEKNPAILAEIVKGLGRYSYDETHELILPSLTKPSLREENVLAAIEAIRRQQDTRYVEPLRAAITSNLDSFSARSIRPAVSTLARIGSNDDDKSKTFKLLASFLGHPKDAVKIAAIESLGTLGDPAAGRILSAFKRDGVDDRVSRAADSALSRINAETPLVPSELKELRDLVNDLKKQNEELRKEFDDLKAQLDADSDKSDESANN